MSNRYYPSAQTFSAAIETYPNRVRQCAFCRGGRIRGAQLEGNAVLGTVAVSVSMRDEWRFLTWNLRCTGGDKGGDGSD